MHRLLILALVLGVSPILAQDGEEQDATPAAEDATDNEDTSATTEELYEDDFELDLGTDDHLEDDEDVFEASVEVSYQQSVSFPTDI